MSDPGYLEIPIAAVTAETEEAVALTLDIPPDLADQFRYRPGQFLTLRVNAAGRWHNRCYSLCSAPNADEPHKIAVKRVRGGLVSNALCDLRAGQLLWVKPPAGLFTPKSLDQDLLLLAAGSGVTPVISILRAALAGGTGRIRLVYANRDDRSVMFMEDLKTLAAAYEERLTVVHWLESLQGLPRRGMLAGLIASWRASEAFICGPEPFMAAASAALRIGAFDGGVHIERFVSLPDDCPVPPAPMLEAGEDAWLDVLIDGQSRRMRWPRQQKLLDTLLEAGVKAPHSCRVGGCSACMCRLVEGKVRMAANLVLDERDLADGWVLACQSYPESEQIRIEIP